MRSLTSTVAVVALVLLLLWNVSVPGGLAPPGSATGPTHTVAPLATAPPTPAYDWAEFHGNSNLTGVASNSPITTSNATRLGVVWASDLYGAALDSPVVAYDATLGATLTYIGTETGNVLAIDVANGQTVWSTWLGSPIRPTPDVSNGSLWIGTFVNPAIFKLNASTGAIDCSVPVAHGLESSPVIATPPGGVPTVYFGDNDGGTSGPLYAVDAANCHVEWEWSGYPVVSGTWAPLAYTFDANGVPLIVLGTADPDCSVYAVNALTGTELWRFQTYTGSACGDNDVGAGAAVGAPGSFGFAGGVAYVVSKLGITFALNLTTGRQIWATNFNQILGVTGPPRSSAALDGTNVVFGYAHGLVDLNATSGSVLWSYQDPSGSEMISSPAIAGPLGSAVVAGGDVAGAFDVVSLATGAQLYTYPTAGFITASPAVSDGNILIASTDGFLYDFAVGGGNSAIVPAVAIDYPAGGATIANPAGSLPLSGTAGDAGGVAGVDVAVQSGGATGPWWDASTRSWSSGPIGNAATLTAAGTASSNWSLPFPTPAYGGTYTVTAYAISSAGQSSDPAVQSAFAVLPVASGPRLSVSPSDAGPGATLTVTGAGFSASESVTFTLGTTTVGSASTDSSGDLPVLAVTIPVSEAFGLTTLTADQAASGDIATGPVNVENSWAQGGYNSTHTNFEPNDPNLYAHTNVGGGTWLELAWNFYAGAPIDGTPAIANGVAYVADTSGVLSAVDLAYGGLLWNYSLPNGSVVDSGVAVDPARGLVFVSTTGGLLTAISTSGTSQVWNASIAGGLSAPVFADGVVYVASTLDTLAAFNESTGASVWSVSLGSALTAAPAVDPTEHLLVEGEANGELVALNASTGAIAWTRSLGGSLPAAATIWSGTVLVGSTDDSVYALSESTGAPVWSYATGGPVSDTGALVTAGTQHGQPEFVIGSGDGNLYFLAATNGQLLYSMPIGGTVIGVSSLDGVAVGDTSSGTVYAARTYGGVLAWNHNVGANLAGSTVWVDSALYFSAENGNLYAYTTFGQSPVAILPATTFDVGFNETGLPSGTTWSVSMNGTTETSATPRVGFSEPNGTYSFAIVPPAGYLSTPSTGNVTVRGHSVNISVAFRAIPPGQYAITFAESGLPSGTAWSVTLNGSTATSTGPAVGFVEPNGTYHYSVGAVNGFAATPSGGTLLVNSSGSTVSIRFVAVSKGNYSVTFDASGLPVGTNWSVDLNGTTTNSTSPTIGFAETNGTYAFTVGAAGGYTGSPGSGSITVAGTPVSVSIAFSSRAPSAFAVTFSEAGLPTGQAWSVTLGGATQAATTGTLAFLEPNGSYAYSMGPVSGYLATPASGTLNVSGAAVRIPIAFVPVSSPGTTYPVTFVETGLPGGETWSVTLNGTLGSSSTNSIQFREVNATYSYAIASVPGYRSNLSSGSVRVSGSPTNVSVSFARVAPGGTGTASLVGLPDLDWIVIGTVVAVGAVASLLVRSRRRSGRGDPPSPPPP